MIYELRTYTLQPGKQGEYLKLNAEVGRKIRGDNYGVLRGSWTTEFGTLNQYVHLWEYPSLDERERLRGELAKNERWTKEYGPGVRPLLQRQDIRFLKPVVPLKPPASSGNVYELRMYRTQPGAVGTWAQLFKGILPVREKYSANVGLWTGEAPQPNEVVHLWSYPDLNTRAKVRAEVAGDPDWKKFVAEGGPLLLEMQSVILLPTDFSAMK
jgi:hypothetical protein